MIDLDMIRRLDAVERRLERLAAADAPFTQSVVAVYYRLTAQAIANVTNVVVDYNSSSIDTHSAVTTGASWRFTAPRSSHYHVDACISYGVGTATSFTYQGEFRKNGSPFLALSRYVGPTYGQLFIQGSLTLYLATGDYLDVTQYQDTGAPVNSIGDGRFQYISIVSV